MKYRKFIPTAITLTVFFVPAFANASYVIEVEGMGIGTVAENAQSTGADFDFVTHDYSIESSDAIQIALTNLSSAVALRGNLLLWSHLAVGHPALEATDTVDISPDIQADTVAGATDDYSYYDESADSAQDPSGVDGDTVAASEPLPASVQNIPSIDASTTFWVLKPADFESFSQMTAARFGF
jgi:hypothetical protein